MTDLQLLFEDYHNAIISAAEQKLNRLLTERETSGIKNIYSFLMLEALEMSVIYESPSEIIGTLEYWAHVKETSDKKCPITIQELRNRK